MMSRARFTLQMDRLTDLYDLYISIQNTGDGGICGHITHLPSGRSVYLDAIGTEYLCRCSRPNKNTYDQYVKEDMLAQTVFEFLQDKTTV